MMKINFKKELKHLYNPYAKKVEAVDVRRGTLQGSRAILDHAAQIHRGGEVPILPRIERYRPVGSSSEVMFRTVREYYGTAKSHVSHVVTDSRWEHSVAYQLERNPNIIAYVKNDHQSSDNKARAHVNLTYRIIQSLFSMNKSRVVKPDTAIPFLNK